MERWGTSNMDVRLYGLKRSVVDEPPLKAISHVWGTGRWTYAGGRTHYEPELCSKEEIDVWGTGREELA